MSGVLATPDLVSLHSGDVGKRVWLHDGNWKRLFTVTQVVDAVRSAQEDELGQKLVVQQQLGLLSERLLKWFSQVNASDNRIAQVYMEFKEPAVIQIVVVQPSQRFDEKLTDAVSDLEWELVHDEKFGQLRINIEIAPGPVEASNAVH